MQSISDINQYWDSTYLALTSNHWAFHQRMRQHLPGAEEKRSEWYETYQLAIKREMNSDTHLKNTKKYISGLRL